MKKIFLISVLSCFALGLWAQHSNDSTLQAKMENVKQKSNRWSGFYLRLDDRDQGAVTVPAGGILLSGSCNWQRFRARLKTANAPGKNNAAPYAAFVLRTATGKVWLDHIRMFEVKK